MKTWLIDNGLALVGMALAIIAAWVGLDYRVMQLETRIVRTELILDGNNLDSKEVLQRLSSVEAKLDFIINQDGNKTAVD